MPKSRYYQHRAGRHSLARFVLLAVLLCGTGFAGYKKYSGSLTWGFNPQKLVADSVLSGKTFETEVREVVSPRAKIKAYLFEDRTNPIISVSFLFKNAGLANDAESEVGISGMAASLLTTGARRYGPAAIQRRIGRPGRKHRLFRRAGRFFGSVADDQGRSVQSL